MVLAQMYKKGMTADEIVNVMLWILLSLFAGTGVFFLLKRLGVIN